jgi:N-acetylmuramoyl-L-alanine amidase
VRSWIVLLALCLPVTAQIPRAAGQARTLHSHRLAGKSYITVGEILQCYQISRTQLSVQADRREITIDGVQHWLSSPVLDARGQLWIPSSDVLKTIDPILRQGRSATRAPIRTIVLDPGHGGSDTGARGARGVEKQLTLDLARRVERLLPGAILTRTTDRNIPLDDRVQFAKSKRADLFISIHFNSGGSAAGIETYCIPPAGTASTAAAGRLREAEASPNNRFDESNVWLAHCVQRSLLRNTGAADRGVRRARFVVIRDAPCPAILVEAGFLSNRAEEQRILTESYRDKLAKSIADGILEYKRCSEIGQMPGSNSPTR